MSLLSQAITFPGYSPFPCYITSWMSSLEIKKKIMMVFPRYTFSSYKFLETVSEISQHQATKIGAIKTEKTATD